jgi:hypothetical protein
MPKRQSQKDLAKADYQTYLAFKNRLHEAAGHFLDRVHRRALGRVQVADQIVKLIIDDWRKVRPHSASGTMGFDPFKQAVQVFDPNHWRDVDPMPLEWALVDCGQAFKAVQRRYKRLSPDDQKEAFPDGLNP